MKLKILFNFSLVLILFSCDKSAKDSNKKVEFAKNSIEIKKAIDTTNTFLVDDFPIDDEMISQQNVQDSQLKKHFGETYSFDKAWFGNNELKQNLVLEMYADFHRLVIFQFYTDNIPPDLLDKMELHTKAGEYVSKKQKLKDFDGLLKQSAEIDAKYFTSKKGIRLGNTKQKIVDIYGNPDRTLIQNGIERAEWKFEGDENYTKTESSNNKPIAKNSFGNQVIMYFKNEKLIAQILFNEIP